MAAFDQRIRARIVRLEREAREHPRRHAVRLTLYVLLGYLPPAMLIATCIAAVACLMALTIKGAGNVDVRLLIVAALLLLGFVAAAYASFGAMFPDEGILPGRPVTAREAPELLAIVEQVRSAAGAPEIREVRLDHRFNASIHQLRAGRGWSSRNNYLVLGVPEPIFSDQ